MGYTETHDIGTVPGGVPPFVPARTVADGSSETTALEYRAKWITVDNFGPGVAVVGWSKLAAEAQNGKKLASGKSMTFTEIDAVTEVSVFALTGGGDVEYDISLSYTRDGTVGLPALTEANGFPSFDDSDTDAIRPGVVG